MEARNNTYAFFSLLYRPVIGFEDYIRRAFAGTEKGGFVEFQEFLAALCVKIRHTLFFLYNCYFMQITDPLFKIIGSFVISGRLRYFAVPAISLSWSSGMSFISNAVLIMPIESFSSL